MFNLKSKKSCLRNKLFSNNLFIKYSIKNKKLKKKFFLQKEYIYIFFSHGVEKFLSNSYFNVTFIYKKYFSRATF